MSLIRSSLYSSDKREKILKICGLNAVNTNSAASPKTITKKKIPKNSKSKDSGTSSEEERWLDAIESGKLEEVFYLNILHEYETNGLDICNLNLLQTCGPFSISKHFYHSKLVSAESNSIIFYYSRCVPM